ncbi:hypothetical protein ABK040_005161 [Willaertia magna]
MLQQPSSSQQNNIPAASAANENYNNSSEAIELLPADQLDTSLNNKQFVYDGISTIDLSNEKKREFKKRAIIFKQEGFMGYLYQIFYSLEGWILSFLVGLLTGVVGAFIDAGSEWFGDFREGICVNWFYTSKQNCCVDTLEGVKCAHWKLWSEIFHISSFNFAGSFIFNFFSYTVLSIVLAISCAWLIRELAPAAAGSGIPELKTILGGFIIKDFLNFITLPVKTIGLILSVGSGLVVGKEGPMVHIAACCGNLVSKIFPRFSRNEANKREILSVSSAVGVAVAFLAPIGGVLFSLEEVSSYFPPRTLFRSFFASIIGVLVVQMIHPKLSGRIILWNVSSFGTWKWFEILPFVFLGIVGGILGALFTKLNILYNSKIRRRYFKNYPILETFIIVTITSLFCYWNEVTREPMNELLPSFFGNACHSNTVSNIMDIDMKEYCYWNNSMAMFKLFYALIIKFLFFSITVGLKVPCGILIPSLMIGSIYGQLVGTFMKFVQTKYSHSLYFAECFSGGEASCITVGIYAFVGAASLLSGVTRAIVSVSVIMMEITGSVFVVPVMISVIIAKWVSESLSKKGVYELTMEMNKYPYLVEENTRFYETNVSSVMTSGKLFVLHDGVTVGDVKKNLLHLISDDSNVDMNSLERSTSGDVDINKYGLGPWEIYGYPIIDNLNDRRILGFISREDLQQLILENNTDLTDDTFLSFNINNNQELTSQSSLVIEGEDGRYLDCTKAMDISPVLVAEQMLVGRLYDMFRALGMRYCLVVRKGSLVGIITKKDLVRWFSEQES